MRYTAIILAVLSTGAIAAPGDEPKPGGGFINRQTGVEGWAYTGPSWNVEAPVALREQRPKVAESLPPAMLCKPVGPDLRIACFDPITPAAARKP